MLQARGMVRSVKGGGEANRTPPLPNLRILGTGQTQLDWSKWLGMFMGDPLTSFWGFVQGIRIGAKTQAKDPYCGFGIFCSAQAGLETDPFKKSSLLWM